MVRAYEFKKHSERMAEYHDGSGDKLEIQCYSDNSMVVTINHTNAVLVKGQAAKDLRDFLIKRYPL